MKRTYSIGSCAPVSEKKRVIEPIYFLIPVAIIIFPLFKAYELYKESVLPGVLRKVWKGLCLVPAVFAIFFLLFVIAAAVYFHSRFKKKSKKDRMLPVAEFLRRWLKSLTGARIRLPRFVRSAAVGASAMIVAATPATATAPTASSAPPAEKIAE